MATQFTPDHFAHCQSIFNLTYHIPYAYQCQELVGFQGKNVLEVGGSLPPQFVFDYLQVKSWSAIETPDYEESLVEVGGIVHTGTILKTDCKSCLGFSDAHGSRYNLFLANIEELPAPHYEKYDLIFSIAAFEHIHKLPAALEKMYLALKPGGQLFSMFSPIWSAPDGHHIPTVVDQAGRTFDRGKNCPIPPWGHLLMRPSEMCNYLYQITDRETAELITFYTYNSNHINRFFSEDYIEFIQQSSFVVERLDLTFPTNVSPDIQSNLENRFPGCRYFSNNGIMMVLRRPETVSTLINDHNSKNKVFF